MKSIYCNDIGIDNFVIIFFVLSPIRAISMQNMTEPVDWEFGRMTSVVKLADNFKIIVQIVHQELKI